MREAPCFHRRWKPGQRDYPPPFREGGEYPDWPQAVHPDHQPPHGDIHRHAAGTLVCFQSSFMISITSTFRALAIRPSVAGSTFSPRRMRERVWGDAPSLKSRRFIQRWASTRFNLVLSTFTSPPPFVRCMHNDNTLFRDCQVHF